MSARALRIFLLGLLFTGRCLAVYLGMDRAELVRELGKPDSQAAMGAHEILLYPNGVRIELEGGKVVQVQGMSVDAKPQAVYLGMDRVALVQALGSPISSAAKDGHEILLYPNEVRIELEDGKVVDVKGVSFGVEPPANTLVQNAPATAAETPAQSGADRAAQAEVEAEKQAYSTQAKARAKAEDAILQMENAHDAPREIPKPGIDPVRLLVEFVLRWVVILITLKLTCLFWGVTVDWSGLMLVALADSTTRMIMREVAIHLLNIYTLFYVDDAIAAIVMVIVLMKVSINRSLPQAVQLTLTAKTFSIVVWAVLITAMMRRSFG